MISSEHREYLRFPATYRSVARAKKDARQLSKQENLPLKEALALISRRNGVPLSWDKALRYLYQHDRLAFHSQLINSPSTEQLRCAYPEAGEIALVAGAPGAYVTQSATQYVSAILAVNRALADQPISEVFYCDWALNKAGREYLAYLSKAIKGLAEDNPDKSLLRKLRESISRGDKDRIRAVSSWRDAGTPSRICNRLLRHAPPQQGSLLVNINMKRDQRCLDTLEHVNHGGRCLAVATDLVLPPAQQLDSGLAKWLEIENPEIADSLGNKIRKVSLQRAFLADGKPIILRATSRGRSSLEEAFEQLAADQEGQFLVDAQRLLKSGQITAGAYQTIETQVSTAEEASATKERDYPEISGKLLEQQFRPQANPDNSSSKTGIQQQLEAALAQP